MALAVFIAIFKVSEVVNLGERETTALLSSKTL